MRASRGRVGAETAATGEAQQHARRGGVLVFLNNITRNIILSNGTEICLEYYGYRVHPQAHGYIIVAFHLRVFQGYRIYFIPWEDHVENLTNNLYITCDNHILSKG